MGAAAEDLRIYQPTERARAIASGALEIEPEVPHRVVLYSHYASICSQRARLTLVEKHVQFTGVMLHYDEFETLTPTYLGLNPRGVVPTIVADGEVVFDSATIMQYVNNRYVGPDLTPGDDAQKALIKKEIETADFFPIRDMVFRIGKDRASHGATYSGWGAGMIPKYIAAMQEFNRVTPNFQIVMSRSSKIGLIRFSVSNMQIPWLTPMITQTGSWTILISVSPRKAISWVTTTRLQTLLGRRF